MRVCEEVAREVGKEVVKMCESEIRDIWSQIDMMSDEHETLRNEIALLLENASHSIQFCNRSEDIVEVLVELFNELVKVLKVERWR